MGLVDSKFRGQEAHYVGQCLLAALSVLAVLIILDAITNAAIVASMGATAFIIFALPESAASRPKVVLGGYLIGLAVGAGCYGLAQLAVTDHAAVTKLLGIACAAFAVGLTIFLMTVTNTEHAPAAGVALGLVIQQCNWRVIAVVLVGAVVLCLAKRALRSWLKNLA